jgi:hypothetical protein
MWIFSPVVRNSAVISSSFHFLRLTCHEIRVLMSMKPQVPQCNSLSCTAAYVACLLRLPNEASPAVRQVGQSSISVADGEGSQVKFPVLTLGVPFRFYLSDLGFTKVTIAAIKLGRSDHVLHVSFVVPRFVDVCFLFTNKCVGGK